MHWLRRRRRFAGWLALFALALQFAVSFGHVHSLPGPASFAGRSVASEAPNGPGSHDRADDICAICVLTSLLASALPGAAPALSSPPVFEIATVALPPAATLAEPRRAAFQSRAPPIA